MLCIIFLFKLFFDFLPTIRCVAFSVFLFCFFDVCSYSFSCALCNLQQTIVFAFHIFLFLQKSIMESYFKVIYLPIHINCIVILFCLHYVLKCSSISNGWSGTKFLINEEDISDIKIFSQSTYSLNFSYYIMHYKYFVITLLPPSV